MCGGKCSSCLLLQDKYVFTGGKGGSFYLLKANALGGYNASNNNGNAFQFIPAAAAQDPTAGIGGIYSGAAYWPAGLALADVAGGVKALLHLAQPSSSNTFESVLIGVAHKYGIHVETFARG